MNQYERMVSYLYSYKDGEKLANVGYAKVEKRGTQCRLMVQMRAVVTQNAPCVYLYRQEEEGIRTILIGKMYARGTNLICKSETKRENLFGTGKSIEDMDGIYIDIQSDICFDTTWNKDYFYKGVPEEYKKIPVVDQKAAMHMTDQKGQIKKEQKAEKEPVEKKKTEAANEIVQESGVMPKVQEETVLDSGMAGEKKTKEAVDEVLKEQGVIAQVQEEVVMDSEMAREIKKKAKEAATGDIQMQSVCKVCPFKDHTMHYGQKILCSFPSMHPFCEGTVEGCVRIEPKDIGCLPMAEWSLSGNRFLLHGYYCYRHLIFLKRKEQRYYIGVPGIYHEKEKKQAKIYGFCEFMAIGDFEKTTGAFGYWIRPLVDA